MVHRTRVVMIGQYPREPGRPVGGVESVTEVLADGLAASGCVDMHFVTGVEGLKQPERRSTPAGVEVHAIPQVATLSSWTRHFINRRRLRAAVEAIDPHIVHVQGTGGAPAYAVLERGRPSVLSIHGVFFREFPFEKGALRRLKDRYRSTFERDALRRAKHVICLNNYTFSTVARWLRDADVRYMDNPVDDSFFDVQSVPEEGRLVLAAPVRRLKGHEFAIRATARLKSEGRRVNLYCVGPTTDHEYHSELERIVKDNGLEDCVHLEGRASRVAVQEHYAKAQIVVQPSLVENAPLAVSEGMAAGKAIVATPAGGVPEMIEDGRTGLIVPFSDPDALASAIGRLLDFPESGKALGDAAKDVAERRFRKHVAVQKTLVFYRDILRSEGGLD